MPLGPRLPRRSALRAGLVGGLAGLVVLTGCDDRGETSSPGSTSGSSPSVDPDSALVDEVLAELAVAEQTASAAGELELATLHRAHIEALDGEVPTEAAGRRPSAEVVRRREQLLQAHLVDAAMAAQSGALARLLASMSAAVSQRLAVL